MTLTAKMLAELIGGTVEGDPATMVERPAAIETAGNGTVSFVANEKYARHVYETGASVLIVGEDISFNKPVKATLIRVQQPYEAFTLLLEYIYRQQVDKTGISKIAHVEETAKMGAGVYAGPFVYVGKQARIGQNVKLFPHVYLGDEVSVADNTIIYPGVRIYDKCRIGEDCIIHAGAVIGSDGFGFVPQSNGTYRKIPQVGHVMVGNNVEIGANTTIDRATIEATRIGDGVKLDNLVQVAHNVEVGDHTVIAAQTGISGSTKLGKHCVLGGQVGVVGHIEIADGTRINAKSGVSKSVREQQSAINGIPAYDYRSSLKAQAVFRKLPELQRKISDLEAKLAALTGKNAS